MCGQIGILPNWDFVKLGSLVILGGVGHFGIYQKLVKLLSQKEQNNFAIGNLSNWVCWSFWVELVILGYTKNLFNYYHKKNNIILLSLNDH